MSSVDVDELLNKAFQLAYLIVGDRMTAIRIVLAAMDNLKVASSVQDKRLSYLPTGRLTSRAARNKVVLSEVHILQRLVYIESEIYERLLEQQQGGVTQGDLIIHFIKHLVRITTKRNSFYVSLGLARLLYNYTTSEATDIYNLVVQDPDRIRDDYYYRSRKGRLMSEVKGRFGSLVKTYRNDRREERLQARDDSGAWADFVRACLLRFTPWFTACVLPADFDPTKNIIPPLLFKGGDPDEEHSTEVNRLHTLLHPDCYERLISALRFDPPERRLEVPHFFISGGDGGPTDDRFNPPGLTGQELEAIKGSLTTKATRRRGASGDSLRVYVDGVERARLEPLRSNSVRLELEEGAEVIQVRTGEDAQEIVMATHLLAQDESGILPSKSATTAEGGQQVSFLVSIPSDPADASPGATVNIQYRETNLIRAALVSLRRLKYQLSVQPAVESRRPRGLFKPALLFMVILVGLAGLLIYLRPGSGSLDGPLQSDRKEGSLAPSQASNQNRNEAQRQQPDDRTIPRNQHEPDPPDGQIASGPKPDEVTGRRVTRGSRTRTDPAMLLSVRKVYVDPLGADALSRQIREVMRTRLQSGARFTVVENRDEADAVFKGTVTQADKDSERASLTVRLVNIDGRVIWPLTAEPSGKNYRGRAAEVCDRLLRELLDDMQSLERRR